MRIALLSRNAKLYSTSRLMEAARARGHSVDVIDPLTVRFNLTGPFAPLIAVLTDRAGMIVSPRAAQALGEKFGTKPVCAGPFRFVERVAQDRIVVERFPQYWNKGAIHFDKVTYLPIVDATVRLANLKSGQLDFIERMSPSDVPGLKDDKRYPYIKVTTGEAWPRALVTRRVEEDGHSYFGPFWGGLARRIMRMITRHFQIRTCTIEIDGRLPRPCLYYDLHACLGPCVSGLTTKEAYAEAVRDVVLFLQGHP